MKTPLSRLQTALLPILAVLAAPHAHADHKWNNGNDPRNLDGSYIFNFNKLIGYTQGDTSVDKDGKPTYKGWSESYFPKNRGYIADRWQDPAAKFKFKSYALPGRTAESIKALGKTGIDLLSPAEKLEIITGHYDFPLTRKLIKDTKPNPKDWWKGVCDGWVTASLNINEPRPIVYVSKKDKIEVPLGASDIKGLLAYYYAKRYEGPAWYVGKSCRANKKLFLDIDGSCKDINAGAFHVVLVNEIGIKHRGFAMDRDATTQVWNQPILKYETAYGAPQAIISDNPSDDARFQVPVKTTITFANELYDTDDEDLEDDEHSAPSYEAVLGTAKQKYRTKTYEYNLELDINHNIIGGEWTGGDRHPDMIWRQKFALPTNSVDKDGKVEEWSVLKDILKMATAYTGATQTEPAPDADEPSTPGVAPSTENETNE